jgi:hypothetical protein
VSSAAARRLIKNERLKKEAAWAANMSVAWYVAGGATVPLLYWRPGSRHVRATQRDFGVVAFSQIIIFTLGGWQFHNKAQAYLRAWKRGLTASGRRAMASGKPGLSCSSGPVGCLR